MQEKWNILYARLKFSIVFITKYLLYSIRNAVSLPKFKYVYTYNKNKTLEDFNDIIYFILESIVKSKLFQNIEIVKIRIMSAHEVSYEP